MRRCNKDGQLGHSWGWYIDRNGNGTFAKQSSLDATNSNISNNYVTNSTLSSYSYATTSSLSSYATTSSISYMMDTRYNQTMKGYLEVRGGIERSGFLNDEKGGSGGGYYANPDNKNWWNWSPKTSIASSYAMMCYDAIYIWSDRRIKTNIIDIDDDNALSILRKIQPKTYQYVDDKIRKGNNTVIGFIAQEIQEIIPNAVSIENNYVPNFYTKCRITLTDVSNILMVTSPIDLSWNPLHDSSGNPYMDASGNACSDASGNKCFNVKFYNSIDNEIICKTIHIIDVRTFLIDISGTQLIDNSGNIILEKDGGYFLYGQEVDDSHIIDKSAIFTVVTAAVQDIDRHQQEDQNNIKILQNEVSLLKEQNASLQNEISELKSQMAIILSKLSV